MLKINFILTIIISLIISNITYAKSNDKVLTCSAKILNYIIMKYGNQVLESCNKKKWIKGKSCTVTNIKPISALETEESKGLRVLIIDDSSMKFTGLTRYKKRVLEYLKESENGTYIIDDTGININEYTKYIFHDLLNLEFFNNLPAELLDESEQIIGEIFSLDTTKESYIGHSNYIFNFIANNSPKSQFILAFSDNENFSKIMRHVDMENDLIQAKNIIDNYFTNQAKSLNYYIKKNAINYISMSFGLNRSTIKNYLIRSKHKSLLIDYIDKSFYNNYIEKLLENNDALLVQANNSSTTSFDVSTNFSDCIENRRRIRVGYFREFDQIIPENGTYDNYNIKNMNSQNCTDVYINFPISLERDKNKKFYARENAPLFSTHGIGAEALPGKMVSSSYSVPIAIAYLIYKKEFNKMYSGHEFDNYYYISDMQNNKLFIDPAFHKQFPVYLYGHLK
ncbi:hypothetical protein QEJ31_02570 [Pigmentibacter sp. JX0631]|uniref:hypothetical protein n=1 Tax=Pigmentibacter sp. JX0631 TaxID=2976982 RepID=UPI002469807E|nr:hypothetical protein [Pigmentibacter sp. JX0631]WGL60485.1 hypothetical protein QEJ31_02570 [Pigmentibacter sp. JX0631]